MEHGTSGTTPATGYGLTRHDQHVEGDEQNEHMHPAITHTHDHYHVSHHHKSGELLGVFEHRSHYHSHEHNHARLVHAHSGHDVNDERNEHDEMAHTHDHTHPARSNAA